MLNNILNNFNTPGTLCSIEQKLVLITTRMKVPMEKIIPETFFCFVLMTS